MKKVVIFAVIILLLLSAACKQTDLESENMEEALEEIIESDAPHHAEGQDTDYHTTTDKSYVINKEDGSVIGYLRRNDENSAGAQNADLTNEEVYAIAEAEVLALYPDFLDNESDCLVEGGDNGDFAVSFFQLSENKEHTGNLATVEMGKSGFVYCMTIFDYKEVLGDSKAPVIRPNAIIDYAYEGIRMEMDKFAEELKVQANTPQAHPGDAEEVIYTDQGEAAEDAEEAEYPAFEVYLNDRGDHKITMQLTTHNDRKMWNVEIINIENNTFDVDKSTEKITMNFIVNVDALTGEIIMVGYEY